MLSAVPRERPPGAPHGSLPRAKVCGEKEHIHTGVTHASGPGGAADPFQNTAESHRNGACVHVRGISQDSPSLGR